MLGSAWQFLYTVMAGKHGIYAHINGLPGGYTPGGNEGEFGILSVYSAPEPLGNYKLRNNRTTGGGEVRDLDVTI